MSADLLDYYVDRVTALSLQRSALLRMLSMLLDDPHAPDVRAKAERLVDEAQKLTPARAA